MMQMLFSLERRRVQMILLCAIVASLEVTRVAYAQSVPEVATFSPEAIEEHSALLRGSVVPHAPGTRVWVEHGITPSFGRVTNLPVPEESETKYDVRVSLSGLAQGTQYYYRVVAENGYGKREGTTVSFVTKGLFLPSGESEEEAFFPPREEENCLSLAAHASDFELGKKITYVITFRNGCERELEHAVLTLSLPPEVNFSYTNYPEYTRDAGRIIYELGKISGQFQSSVVIEGSVAIAHEPLTIHAELRAAEDGRVVAVSTALDAHYKNDKNTLEVFERLAAKVAGALGGIMKTMWFWIVVAPIMIFLAGYFAFGRNGKRKKEEAARFVDTGTQIPLPPPRA